MTKPETIEQLFHRKSTVSAAQVALYLGTSTENVRRMAREGVIPSVFTIGQFRFSRKHVEAMEEVKQCG